MTPGGSSAPPARDAVNEVILEYGERQDTYVRVERRDQLVSPLFDVQRRSVVGWRVVYEHGPWLLREALRYADPAEIGERMRAVAVRPGTLQLAMLPCGYLSTRQLLLMEAGADLRGPVADDRLDDLTTLCAFTRDVGRAFRAGEETLFPPAAGGPHRLLSAGRVAELEELLEEPAPDQIRDVRRLSGSAATFGLLLHGEQRDGLGGQGPYTSSRGHPLFIVEYTDLRNDFLPWAPRPDALPFDALALVYEVDDRVGFRHDVYGTAAIEPLDFFGLILRLRVMAREGSTLRPLAAGELADALAAVELAGDRLYEAIVGWPDRLRTEYGGWLFANHLKTFLDAAGAPRSVAAELYERAGETTARTVDALLADPEGQSLYRQLHRHEPGVPIFSPAVLD